MRTGVEAVVMTGAPLSVTVKVWLPAVFKLTVKLPIPAERMDGEGRVACGSLELKVRVSEYPVAMLPKSSLAVTVELNATPATFVLGTEVNTNTVALFGITSISDEVMVKASLVAEK